MAAGLSRPLPAALNEAAATRRRLGRAWAWLSALTLATMAASHTLPPAAAGAIGIAGGAAVLALAFFKARMLLMVYLGLASAPAGWRIGLLVPVAFTCALLLVAQVVVSLS